MEITTTLNNLSKNFEEWHEKKYNALHSRTIQQIEQLSSSNDEEISNVTSKLLDVINLFAIKLDGNSSNITSLNDINILLNKTEATNNSINFKTFNEGMQQLQQLKNLVGNNTSASNSTIFERLTNLENSNLSTSNVNNLIQSAFKGQTIEAQSNLNNFLTPGIYKCTTNNTAQTLTNSPTTLAFNLIVLEHAQDSVRQILIINDTNDNGNKIFTRNYYDYMSNWSNWTQIYGEHNTTKLAMEVEFSDGTHKTYNILTTQ